jgi:hypothetical protein
MNAIAQTPQYEGVADRICKLLGQGIQASMIAHAVGCDQSYISQLMSEDAFKERVQELKFLALSDATNRDEKLNALEDSAIKIVEEKLSYGSHVFKTASEATRALSMINALKRRGAAADGASSINQNSVVVNLVMPTHITNKFMDTVTMDVNNQIIKVADTDLVTMQSGTLENSLNTIGGNNEHSKSSQQRLSNLDKFF